MSEGRVVNEATADGAVRWRVFLEEARDRLRAAGSEQWSREALWLVEEVAGEPGQGHLVLDEFATVRAVAKFDALLARREAGEPIQYVLGHWPFRDLELAVDGRVLIPRPETEGLVDHVLVEVDRLAAAHGYDRDRRLPVVDLGTGSGAIALAVAVERDHVDVVATDRSTAALDVARANLAGVGRPASRVQLCAGEWFAAVPTALRGSIGVIASNPPYIAASETLPRSVADWEPAGALIAGETGSEDLLTIVDEAPSWLMPGGALVMELAPWQAATIIDAGRARGMSGAVHRDLAGRDRVVVLRP